MQNVRNNLHLIWADKIVIWLAITAAGLAGLAWLLAAVATGVAGANHVLASLAFDGWTQLALGAFAFWATLRALDFVFHGSTWRLFHAPQAIAAEPTAVLNGKLAH